MFNQYIGNNNTFGSGAVIQSATVVLQNIRGDRGKKQKFPNTVNFMGETFYTFRGFAKELGIKKISFAKSLFESGRVQKVSITDNHDAISVTTKEEIEKIKEEGLYYIPGKPIRHMGRIYYPSAAAAEYLNMNRGTVSGYMNSGKIPSVWAKTQWIANECALTTKEELDKFKASLQNKTPKK